MANISSSRPSGRTAGTALLVALLFAGALGLAGCGNDHPANNSGTMRVDLSSLVDQVGGGPSTSDTGVSSSAATTAVKSMIIGAVVVTFTNTPLTSDTNITNDLSDKLASDVINSINFFSIVDLPTTQAFVEFKVPPPGAGHWQVAAIGTKNQIATFDQLNDKNVAIYYGFDPTFHTTSATTAPDVTIEMKRACFIDLPPKGCASFGDGGTIVITSDVTILDIQDGTTSLALTGSYSYGTSITSGGEAAAEASINGSPQVQGAAVSGHTLTVYVTHPTAPGQAACSGLTHANYAASLLNPDCVSTFITTFE